MNEQQQQHQQADVAPPIKMDPRFSFNGSVTKPFHNKTGGAGRTTMNRRSSDCTGMTTDSPDSTNESLEQVSDDDDDNEYVSSSGEEESDSSEDEYTDSQDENELDLDHDLMNDVPIAVAPPNVIPPSSPSGLTMGSRMMQMMMMMMMQHEQHKVGSTTFAASGQSTRIPQEQDVDQTSFEKEKPGVSNIGSSSGDLCMTELPGEASNATPKPHTLYPDVSMCDGSEGKISATPSSQSMEEDSEENYESSSNEEDEEAYSQSSGGNSDLMADLPMQMAKTAPPSPRQRVSPPRAAESQSHVDFSGNTSERGFSVANAKEEESNEDESFSDGSRSESLESEYTDDDDLDSQESGTSYDSSEDWSSSGAYDDLLESMPIALGRNGKPIAAGPAGSARPPLARFLETRESKPVVPTQGLPVMAKPGLPGLPISGDELPFTDPPMEGLAILQNIRSELEKVGQLIVKNKEGEKFLQRAQILTSINYLASNVPKCVLEDLGREIRDQIKKEEEKNVRATKSSSVMDSLVDVPLDEHSEASELSHMDKGSCASDSDEDLMEDDFFPEAKTPETLRRKFNMDNFMPLKSRLSIRDSRALSLSTHSAHALEPMLVEDDCPVKRGTSRTYSFASVSSTSSASSDWQDANLPVVTYFNCALLFVDISGFTKLSTLLDPENLSKVINTYFEVLVSHINDFNGDIQKFAGDALFAEFRASEECPLPICAELAAACAAALVRDCADFPVSTVCGLLDSDDDGIPAHLNVHCGLGIGEMAGLHIGDNETRREYMYLGNPIKQTAHACDYAQLGEAAASREFCEILSQRGIFKPDFSSEESAYVIAERAHSLLNCNEVELLTSQKRNARSRGITDHVEGLKPESLKEYRRLMSLYVHPVAVSNDAAAENDFIPCPRGKDRNNSRDRQLEEAELRSVYTMFINPRVAVEMSGDAKHDTASVEIVHDIMKIVNRELRRYNGHMRQFVMDDKGMVAIATFGLRGSTFPNMIGERALPCTIALHNALQFELGIECKIGATFGDVYCGAVGGETRNEYAVMGPSVNLAARLMSNKSNPGILVDNAVRRMASEAFAFNALPPIKAKGYKELVHIFEPLSPIERGWGQIIPNFVGREDQMTKIAKLAMSYSRRDIQHRPQIIIVKSSTGMGKSTLLAHSIEKIKKLFVSKRASIGISKYVGRECDSLKPFYAAAQLLGNMLSHFHGCFDDLKSLASGKDSCFSSMGSFSMGSVSFSGESTVLSMGQFADRLEAVFIEIGAPTAFLEYTKALIFGDDQTQEEILPELDASMVSTLTSAFKRCNSNLRLGVLAIDDAHQCDEASWLVFQELFESADNILFMGTTSASNLVDMKINKIFLKDLEDEHAKAGRYHPIELGNLSREEVLQMIMKSMALQKSDVTDQMLDSVFKQSLGMPMVANDLIIDLKEKANDGSLLVASGNTNSVADIFLHKIDGLDIKVRDSMNVCALLGQTIVFEDIVCIITEMGDGKEEDIRQECQTSLDYLLKEGILAESSTGEYHFSHELWRTIPLKLMLDSRKRDIHRKIAQNLEGRIDDLCEKGAPIEIHEKIFSHWKATGDTTKSVNAARALRRILESEGNFSRCVEVLEEVLSLWGWKPEPVESRLGGLSKGFLDHVNAEELSSIVSTLVALGTAYTESSRPSIGVVWWENSLRIMNSTKSAPSIRDRSIVFAAFNGISKAIQEGHLVQDVFCRYEQAMIRKYIHETRAHGRLIHHVHALFLQMKLYGRQGAFDKAIAVHSIIKYIYKPEKHSDKLRHVYGQDSGALSFALCAFWETLEGETKTGLKICRNVLKDFLPRLDRGFFNMFSLMFPLTMAFKEAGYPTEAKAFFVKLIVVPYGDCPEGHPLHYLVKVFPAISILFSACSDKNVPMTSLTEWAHWALNQQSFGQKLQMELGSYGRCADSITAEVCLILVEKLDRKNPLRARLLKSGLDIIGEALLFHLKFGMKCAIKPAKLIQLKLRSATKNRR